VQDVADAIRAEVERAAVTFRELGEPEASRPRGSGKWSRKEILGHLIDSAANNHQRFVRAQFSSPFVWPGYDQVAWVELHAYGQRPWLELVDLWVALNRHVAGVVESVPPGKLATPCIIDDREATPLEWWMRDYLRHLKHHVGQIEAR
jgi:DinB family protein